MYVYNIYIYIYIYNGMFNELAIHSFWFCLKMRSYNLIYGKFNTEHDQLLDFVLLCVQTNTFSLQT